MKHAWGIFSNVQSAAARIGLGAVRCGYDKRGKLALGKIPLESPHDRIFHQPKKTINSKFFGIMLQVLFTFVVPYDLVEAVLLEFQNQVNKSNCMDPVQPHFFSLNRYKRNGWAMFAWLSCFILGKIVTWQSCCMTMFSHGQVAKWQNCLMEKLSQGKLSHGKVFKWKSCHMAKFSHGKVVTWQSCQLAKLGHVTTFPFEHFSMWQLCHETTLSFGNLAMWKHCHATTLSCNNFAKDEVA